MIDRSPLRHRDLFHTGFVVDDLTTAAQEFGDLLGVRSWRDGGGEVRLRTESGLQIVTTAYVLSAEGPHHVELVQSVPGTLYTVPGSGSAHHLGYWVDDVRSASAALSACGLGEAASISVGGDDRPPMCAYHRAGEAFYIEVVDRALQPMLLGARPGRVRPTALTVKEAPR